jgi:S-adenosylmethionine:tRNA ribosyltransferase-isomerase
MVRPVKVCNLNWIAYISTICYKINLIFSGKIMDSGLFEYSLPKDVIAQYPARERSSSRLLVFDRATGKIEHRFFRDIVGYFRKGDVLVLNDSKVFPAKLRAVKETGGAVNILLVERIGEAKWHCLARGTKKEASEMAVSIAGTQVCLTRDGEFWVIQFPGQVAEDRIIRDHGQMPLPPYIKRTKRDEIDFERYQTVYAETEGSIAAPTAGFHFTKDLLDYLELIGVDMVRITLHIGIGTFLLINKAVVEDHGMHREYYHIGPEVKAHIQCAKDEGRRIIACGTSAVRTLETAYSGNGGTPLKGYTDLFIYPGYRFKMVDAMITNFHLPRSTPLLLVSAFAGRDELLKCYGEAIQRGYSFYSYGDAMLVQ